MKNVSAALVKAQKQFGPALKSSSNPHFKSKYADLAACVEAVIDALNAHGIALMQQTRECSDGVTVETVFIHESGETLTSGPLHVPASKHDAQGYGSALTYARRYSLMAACGIAPEDDDGNAAASSAPQRKPNGALPGKSDARPTSGVEELVDEEQKTYLQLLASVTLNLFKQPDGIKEICDRLDRESLDSDCKVYYWSLLPSNVRSAIKREQEARHAAPKEQAKEPA
jgi:hypothetical protein